MASKEYIDSFSVQLNQAYQQFLIVNNLQSSNCLLNSTTSKWFVVLKLDDDIILQVPFFDGLGFSDPVLSFPDETIWRDALQNNLNNLFELGYDYYINNNTFNLISLGCDDQKNNKRLFINVGIQLNINCK
jgi:hypothetical protein